jgi:methionine biosynthesis protein MetW
MNIKNIYEDKYKYDVPQQFNSYYRNLLLKRVIKDYIKPGKRILDLGCNDGVVAEYLESIGLNAVGFDISERSLGMAKQRGLRKLVLGNVESPLPFEDSSFDIVWWGDNVEHLFEPLKTLKEIDRILKNDGLLFLSFPNTGWFINRIYYLFTGMIRRTEGHLNPPWEWEHIRFFNRSVMKSFLKEGGFRMERAWSTDQRVFLRLPSLILPSLCGSIMIIVARRNV